MDQITQIGSSRCTMMVSVCLLIFALYTAMARAQDKGLSSGADQPRASTQPRESDGAPSGSPASGTVPCAQQSAVSELGCFPTRPIRSPQPFRQESQAAPGGFLQATPRIDFWAGDFSQQADSALRTAAYRQPDSPDLRRISEQADDPMAPVSSFTFETSYSSSFQGMRAVPGQSQTVYRYSIPFDIQGTLSVLRVSLPNEAASRGRIDGRGGVEVMDLLAFSNKWGHWGAGASASFGASHGFGIDGFRAGPAVAFVTNKGRWQIGALSRNLFSRNVAVSSIQPVIAYQAGNGWSLSAGNLEYAIDWHHKEFAAVPVGFQIAKVVARGSRYFRFSVAPQYSLRSIYGAPRWTVTTGVAILGPSE